MGRLPERTIIETTVSAKLAKDLQGLPLQIEGLTFKHIMFDRKVTDSISRKMVMEQSAERKQYELQIATQDAENARTVAKGKSDATRIMAEGQVAAIVLKGKVQADAQAAITHTLTPEYLKYKAFDGESTQYDFVPVGRDGLPTIVDAEPPATRLVR